MNPFAIFKTTALSFPETSEQAHFDKISFKFRKKIFATYNKEENQATLKLSEIDQDVFAKVGGETIYPVPNKWEVGQLLN